MYHYNIMIMNFMNNTIEIKNIHVCPCQMTMLLLFLIIIIWSQMEENKENTPRF